MCVFILFPRPHTRTQTGPTDLRHFDPTLTNLPPTLSDLITTDRALYLEGFDYVAPPPADTTTGETPTPQGESLVDRKDVSTRSNGALDSSNEETADTDTLTQLVSAEINSF